MLANIRGQVRFKEPMSFHTSLRIGGPAEIFIVPQDMDDIRRALIFADREQLRVVIIGGGNNLLVRDQGIRGIVLKLEGSLGRAEFCSDEVVVGAGVSLSALIREAAAQDLGGLESLVGIPATIGGALAMNAGNAEGRIADSVSAAYFLYPDGTIGDFKPDIGSFKYHELHFPTGAVIVGCRLRLHRRPLAEIQKDIRLGMKQRKNTDPIALACARIWKDPRGELTAAELIEKSALKGKKLNGAQISAKHLNFVVNREGATAADVLVLMEITRERVLANFGITLEPEIRILGS